MMFVIIVLQTELRHLSQLFTVSADRFDYQLKTTNTNNMLKHFSLLYKDFRLLKFSFTVLTIYLLMYELYNWLVTKPTFQSVTQTQGRFHKYNSLISYYSF